MIHSQKEWILLRIRIEASLYDTMTDLLLAYPTASLDFVALPINRHHAQLSDLQEQVSGFQSGYEFQIECWLDLAQPLDAYLQQTLAINQYELLLTPLILPFWR